MSEIKLKSYIDKKEKGSGEYHDLYLKGIEYLQNLSSDHWTDFNQHDPGVTILENLVYAATNLSFKVDLPINDILTESKNGKLISGDNGFFIPSEILTTNPITLKDFSKIFIDKILNIKNAWIETQSINNKSKKIPRQNHLRGLYNVYVELYEYENNIDKLDNEKDRIKAEVRKLFLEHRNLCEDLHQVIILDPVKLQMELDLSLHSNVNGEEVLVSIYYKINNYLSHEAKFSSLTELINQNIEINSIFNGPSLENGFILNKELRKRKKRIKKSALLRIINEEIGVVHVDKFELKMGKYPKTIIFKNDKFTLPIDKIAVLELPKSINQLHFREGNIRFKPDIKELKHLNYYLISKSYGNYKSVSNSLNTIDIPNGDQQGISSYHTIRDQFPVTYGINKFGMPNDMPPKRQAQAKQLKAYLLPFDQIMINFLAQLSGIYQLYDAKSKGFQSYFYKQLNDMLALKPLVSGSEKKNDSDFIIEWQNTLQRINSQFDSSGLERFNDVANNLLSRYSEKIPEYSLEKINKESYGKAHKKETFRKNTILNKRKLISNYAQLSYNRSRGYNYSMNFNDIDEHQKTHTINQFIPGIIQKVAILMGIQNFKLRFLSDVLSNYEIKMFSLNEYDSSHSRVFLEVLYSTKGMEIIETIETDSVTSDKKLKHSFYFKGSSENILNSVLKDGIIRNNYDIVEIEFPNQKKIFQINFKSEDKLPEIIHVSNSEKNADRAIQFAINQLRIVSQQSEGLYLVEHLLLAPSYHGNHFGFSFVIQIDKCTKLHFIQNDLLPYQKRNNQLDEVMLWKKKNLSFQYEKLGDKFFIQICNKEYKVIAKGTNTYKDETTINTIIKLLEFRYEKKEYKKSIKKCKCYAYYKKGKVNESFFSFGISIILPSWPVRFQQLGFRTKFDEVLYENSPAHIAHHSYWLNIDKLHSFELGFSEWLNITDNNEEKMALSYNLINKLKEYHHLCDH